MHVVGEPYSLDILNFTRHCGGWWRLNGWLSWLWRSLWEWLKSICVRSNWVSFIVKRPGDLAVGQPNRGLGVTCGHLWLMTRSWGKSNQARRVQFSISIISEWKLEIIFITATCDSFYHYLKSVLSEKTLFITNLPLQHQNAYSSR